jgi:EAL domain-containing protein (putative c-di-GMP-specific phosphodiesterase class I)/GGDEF domain-containing protein
VLQKFNKSRVGIFLGAAVVIIAVLILITIRSLHPSIVVPLGEFYIITIGVLFSLVAFTILLQRSYSRERYQLTHDNATGLPWRTQIPKQVPNGTFAYVYIILKNYNQHLERYGLSTGDPIIKAAAKIFQENTLCEGTLYRFSDSDLFFICKTHQESLEVLVDVLQQKLDEMADKYIDVVSPEGLQIHPVFAVGIAPTTSTIDSETLITYAKFAAFEASKIEGAQAQVFDFKAYLQRKVLLERRHHLPEIIDSLQLATVFQPIISCKTGKIYGYEALTRPTNPAYEDITDLLDDAEVLGIYSRLEMAMTLTAIQAFRSRGGGRLFINMAPETIRSKIYDAPIKEGLFDNIKFVIEIIERGEVLADIITLLKKTISNLNAMIALDDFGTGYSNHLALLNSKPDIVKVDRALIQAIDTDADKQQAYENIVSFARGMGTKVLAEGIETQREFEYLLRLGMDFSQGYFIGRPGIELQEVPEAITQLVVEYHDFSALLEQQQLSQSSV